MDINNYVSIDKLTLVYEDEDGVLHRQPGNEVVTAGALIDPETETELSLVGFMLKG